MTLARGLRSALLGRRDVSRDEISAAEQRFAGTLFIYPEGRAPRRAQRVDCWSVLYLELGGEGPDGCVGTRVEIPTPVFHDYFGVDQGSEHWVTVRSTVGRRQLVRLRRVGDQPPSIRLPFVRSSPPGPARRAVVRMERTGHNAYTVDHRTRDQEGYLAWLSRCDEDESGGIRFGFSQV